MKQKLIFISICLQSLLQIAAFGQIPDASGVLYVKKGSSGTGNSWNNATGELADALKSAKTNTAIKQIWVSEGIYYPLFSPAEYNFGTANGRNNSFLLVKDVMIYGGFVGTETTTTQRDTVNWPHKSILSGDIGTKNDSTDNAYHIVLSVGDVGTAMLNGFTISDGNTKGFEDVTVNSQNLNPNGAGIYNYNSSPILTNLTIIRNTTLYAVLGNDNGYGNSGGGGGMYNYNSSPTLINVTISGNMANRGGGIYNQYNSGPTLTNVTISGNTAIYKYMTNGFVESFSGCGGGMYNYNSFPILTNVALRDNKTVAQAGGNGGGAGMCNNHSSPTLTGVTISRNATSGGDGGGGMWNNESSPILTNVTINENMASQSGGGIYSVSSSPILTNVIISGNTASTSGGIYSIYSSPILTNVTISGNTATYNGGGMYNYNSSPTLANVTISGNKASTNGGGMYNIYNSSPKVSNSIIWGNNSGIYNYNNSIPLISYSIIEGSGGSESWVAYIGTDGSNNLDTDPKFVSAPDYSTAPFSGGNYLLQTSSPAINAGNNGDYNGPLTDLAGNARIVGIAIDLGAYEYYEMTTPVALYDFYVLQKGNTARLQWQTVSETNNQGFDVERSVEGKKFGKIGSVPGKGTTAIAQNYSFTDNSPALGMNYYRLKQTNLDNSIAYSEVRRINFSNKKSSLTAYPNPVISTLTVTLSGEIGVFQVYDATGKTVLSTTPTGSGTLRLNVSKLPAGIYFYTLNGQNGSFVKQ